MKSSSKKRIIVLLLMGSLLLVFMIIMGIFIFNRKTEGNVSIDNLDSNLYITNALPIGDEMGKNLKKKDIKEDEQEYVEFSVKEEANKNTRYEIYLQKEDVSSEIDDNYIKLYLTDMQDKAVKGFESNMIPTFNSLKVDDDESTYKILYRGEIKALEEKKFKLRMWLSDSSAIEKEKKEFKIKLGARVY